MSQPDFVHLSVHSEYALTDSLVRLPSLMRAVRDRGMGAVAVADTDNMFALIRAQKAAQGAGVKPIMGAEVLLAIGEGVDRVTLIASDRHGYRRLCEALSSAHTSDRTGTGRPILLLDEIAGPGVICLAGGVGTQIGASLLEDAPGSDRPLMILRRAFAGSVYLKLSRTGHPADDDYVEAAVRAAKRMRLPVVATNEVRFLDRSDHASHEIRVKIARKDNSATSGASPEQYLKTPQEMAELFSDIPSAIENTVVIAQRANLDIPLGEVHLPKAPVPEGKTEDQHLKEDARRGLDRRLGALYPGRVDAHRKAYDDRLDYELSVIESMKFPGYFLIVADFIRWAKSQNIPVGPGRGSGAGSLVAYSLGITDLDPLAHGLLFERFLNPERVSMPDFDVDFCMDRRDEVIQYVTQTYGRSAVSQIATFGTMAARMVVRDTARALGHPYLFGDRLAKLIPGDPGVKLRHAIESGPDLQLAYETDAEAREVLDHALNLEGLARQVGKHAGGVLIAPGKLTDFTPLYSDADGSGLISQYDKDDVESAGLIKFDFLGLRTLTILQEAVDTIHRSHTDTTIDLLHLDMKDPKTLELINSSKTASIFQLESHGMRRLIRDLQPESFEELTALVALFRPGPLQAGMVDDYIARKHGRAEVRYPHPKLESVLAPTYGVFVYQEQVMEAARVLAGYSLGQADILRKAMGKKNPEEMARQRQVFVDGCGLSSELPADEAGAIFDLIETFAGYGFNKSHSAAYALISFQTAYLKAHYPAEFMAAALSSEMHDTEKVVATLSEVDRMGLTVRLPSINVSNRRFVVSDDGAIVYGLEAIKGVGRKAVDILVDERTVNGPYESLFDFCLRTGIDKRALHALGKAGALDQYGPHRASVMAQLDDTLGAARQSRKKSRAQEDMFGLGTDMLPPPDVPAWSMKATLQAELESFGCFVSGHPISAYRAELEPVTSGTFASIAGRRADDSAPPEGSVCVSGYVVNMDIRPGKRGSFARVRVDDSTAQFEVFVPPKLFAERNSLLKAGEVLVIDGRLEADDYQGGYRIVARELRSIDQIRERHAWRLALEMTREQVAAGMSDLKVLLDEAPPGPASVDLIMPDPQGRPSVISLGVSVLPTVELVDAIEGRFGPVARVETRLSGAAGSSAAPARTPIKIRPAQERHREMEELFEAAEASMG